MTSHISEEIFDLAFRKARTFNSFTDRPVAIESLRELYDLLKWGPTSTNQQPLRLIWCVSKESKCKLAECAAGGNAPKILQAPVTTILGMDLDFVNHLPRMFPHADARSWYGDDPKVRWDSALRNSSLQAGYFIIAARLLGLDTNPMLGFDEQALNAAFFPDSNIRVNMVSTLGYGEPSTLYPRAPRFSFEEVNQII
ncbi:malonic semialdehyde reductase [Sodalis sp. C49]|uniref:malonic semialdehyde reductase n=1 Tax=Sodalis sp. C49 TaxID=3228929 RepID=UPI003965A7F9